MVKKRTLGEELADLLSPAPKDFALDDTGLTAGDNTNAEATLHSSDDELKAAAAHIHPRDRKSRARSRLPDIVLANEAYRGKLSSRAELLGEKNTSDADSGSDLETSDSGQPQDEHHLSLQESNDNRQGQAKKIKTSGRENYAAEPRVSRNKTNDKAWRSESADFDSQATNNAALSEALKGVAAPQDAELSRLESEYSMLEKDDGDTGIRMQHRKQAEHAKARSVACQRRLWERCLETRILLQKSLQGSHRLPPVSILPAGTRQSEEIKRGMTDVEVAARETLGALMELQSTLQELFPGTASNPTSTTAQPSCIDVEGTGVDNVRFNEPSKGRESQKIGTDVYNKSSEELWDIINAQSAGFYQFRDSSVDRWHDKMVLTSGTATLRNGLRALNQRISSQIAAMMQDEGRVRKRTQMLCSMRPRILCIPQQDLGQLTASKKTGESDEFLKDSETYDDGEFYQQLLKEFLEAAGAYTANHIIGVQQATRKRKVVDKRASKGRRIRYNVQEKLVNFMTPVLSEAPPLSTQLFANLFGYSASK